LGVKRAQQRRVGIGAPRAASTPLRAVTWPVFLVKTLMPAQPPARAGRARIGDRLVDVAVTGPGSRDIVALLEGAPTIRTAAWLERLPPPGIADVVVLTAEPGTERPDLGIYGGSQPIVVVFIRRPADSDVMALLRAGALVHGEFTRVDLIAAVNGARRGDAYLSPTVATAAVHYIRRPLQLASDPGRTSTLSGSDCELLDLLATGASNLAIARHLGVATQTVRNRVSVVYGKLGVHSRAEAVAHWLADSPSLTNRPLTPYRLPRPAIRASG
jgi:DNA-binding NarL/FixJ family response regulator